MSQRRSRLTPEERSARARIAALSRWSQRTEAERVRDTQAARDGLQAKFDAMPNPDAARRLHMARMAAQAARKRKGGTS